MGRPPFLKRQWKSAAIFLSKACGDEGFQNSHNLVKRERAGGRRPALSPALYRIHWPKKYPTIMDMRSDTRAHSVATLRKRRKGTFPTPIAAACFLATDFVSRGDRVSRGGARFRRAIFSWLNFS